MNIINQTYAGMQDYWNKIPPDTFRQTVYAIGGGLAYSFLVHRGDPLKTIVSAIAFGSIVVIRACVTPIFKDLIAPRRHLTFGEEMCRNMIPMIVIVSLERIYQQQATLNRQQMIEVSALIATYAILTFFHPQRCDVDYVAFV